MSRTINITAEQELEKILENLTERVQRSDIKIKEWVVDAAHRIETLDIIPTTMISATITRALKDSSISKIYVRSCLEEKYKEPHRVENARKRVPLSKKKMDIGNGHFAKTYKNVTDKLQEYTHDPLSKVTKQQIRKMTDVQALRDVAIFNLNMSDQHKYGLEAAVRRMVHLEEELKTYEIQLETWKASKFEVMPQSKLSK
jgi:hypothetical protein